jgi:uncharacterized protein
MSKDLIRYDLMVQDALKGVVRKLLVDAARDGLPGEHHFYISFRTEAPGVRLSQRMREKYPQEMTIVLQHQFWDLGVTEHSFEVGLSFNGVPERLLVPFDALSGFFDPSVKFGLKFELTDDGASAPAPPARPMLTSVSNEPAGNEAETETQAPAARPLRKTPAKAAKLEVQNTASPDEAGSAKLPAGKAEKGEASKEDSPKADAHKDGAQIVSLDAFRKKT